jgi:hypothetical protein
MIPPASHTEPDPLMAEGRLLTEIVFVLLQPVPIVYVMFVTPKEPPVTMPLDEPTVATPGRLLVQVPPIGVEPRVIV